MAIVTCDPQLIVQFCTSFGIATGHWMGDAPLVGSRYNVEIELDGVLTYGVEVTISGSNIYHLESLIDDKVRIIGLLESLDDDGYAILRLDGNIVAFMSIELDALVGQFVQIDAVDITLYPYEV